MSLNEVVEGSTESSSLGTNSLIALTALLENVILPIERTRNDSSIPNLKKFISTIKQTVQQVTGTISIKLPPKDDLSDREAIKNHDLIWKYKEYVADWEKTIRDTLDRENKRQPDQNYALGEIEFWRSKSATLSTLHQQLSHPMVSTVLDRLKEYSESGDNKYTVDLSLFTEQFKQLTNQYTEAKDNEKFLNTLERQFKNFTIEGPEGLKIIHETIPSLLNGLKLIWTISRHYKAPNKMENLFQKITNEIGSKVEKQINIRELFTPKPDVNYVYQLDEAIRLIDLGKNVLVSWKSNFNNMKKQIEEEGAERIIISANVLARTIHVADTVLDQLNELALTMKQFLAFLGDNLKKVTGDTGKIDNLISQVKELADPFINFGYDPFDKQNKSLWATISKKFKSMVSEIDEKTKKLIIEAFGDLRSSEGAFDLLQNFKNIETRQEISAQMEQKYSDVLRKYQRELKKNKEIFDDGNDYRDLKDGKIARVPNISLNKPPIAGSMSWARSVFNRIQQPILKFMIKEKQLDQLLFNEVKNEFKQLAGEIYDYQEKKFSEWSNNVIERAMTFLNRKLLDREKDKSKGTYIIKIGSEKKERCFYRYKVNFDDQFRILIKEVKYLEKMGCNPAKTITNIALQEAEYLSDKDRLNNMLDEYHDAIDSLKEIERELLIDKVEKLNEALLPGWESLNLNSLGIKDYIANCIQAINEFKDAHKKVSKHAQYIENIIHSIEDAIIIKELEWDRMEPLTIQGFYEFFEKHQHDVVNGLITDYFRISELLKTIETSILGGYSMKAPQMKEYYYYWERRVYNALVKMTVRALITLKCYFTRPYKNAGLFRIVAEYDHPEVNTNPSLKEVDNLLGKLYANIIDIAKLFPRWKDGSCLCPEPKSHPNTEEKQYIENQTFFRDINENPTIFLLSYEIGVIKKYCSDKLVLFFNYWKDSNKRSLWEQKNKAHVEKFVEKNPPTSVIEKQMFRFKQWIQEFQEQPEERTVNFMTVDFRPVIQKYINSVKEWLAKYGKVLSIMGDKELQVIKKEIEEFREKLRKNPTEIESLKEMLKVIADIRNSTMDMEFRIADVQEKYRILKIYDLNEDPEKFLEAYNLDEKWKQLVLESRVKDLKLIQTKKLFAKDTKNQVEELKSRIHTFYQHYKSDGPSSPKYTLDEGLELLKKVKEDLKHFNAEKDKLIEAEGLFGLDISSFPGLHEIEEENRKLDSFFDMYRKFKDQLDQWATLAWNKIDAESLSNFVEQQFKVMKKQKDLADSSNNPSDHPVFRKVDEFITKTRESVPLIINLKAAQITDRHWEKLLKETGNKMDMKDVKNLTLEQVFALNLNNYPDKVDEIVQEASNEAKNEKEISKIEQYWRVCNFEIAGYKKNQNAEERGYALKGTDEVKGRLEEDLTNLQQVASSKYVAAFRPRVNTWEKNLNLISEVIDIWLLVQRKWQYLEGIFIGADDIRLQLPEEAKRFDKIDKVFMKIMESTFKNPNILSCCVLTETRLAELKNLSGSLDQCQKSLSEYLDSKRNIFARFYFISDDELLSILGSSEPEAIQPHMLKLFDNVKRIELKGRLVAGMVSEEGEKFDFREPRKAEGAVENWMGAVDKEMQITLKKITKEGVFFYHKEERISWVKKQLGMVCLVGTQIWWTWRVEDVFRKVREGNKYAMKQESQKQTKDLNDLIDLVRSDLNDLQRKKVNSLIILDVHARDIVDRFVRDSILDAKEFEWESQLRFYWLQNLDDISIEQTQGKFSYGYEYQGLNGRLVITPLTDRCVMTLTTALKFYLGGAPAGPAGTGKTETVKDLAKSLAIRCVVNNCGEGLDYKAMGTIFSGLSQTGFWGCFDEFNRISPEVLSIVAQQVKTIQFALKNEKKTLNLLSKELNLVPTVGIFVTMNPGYAGRSELPDNLKALFRPVVMVQPDLNMICEIMLMSEGFNSARLLAKKMVVLYKLAKEQLSKQYHYDFGLRALKSVLVMAGTLKRDSPDISEDSVLMRALRDMNKPKFIYEDVPLFSGLIQDLFPNLQVERVGHEDLKRRAYEYFSTNGFDVVEVQVDKTIQLYETMLTRHTTMIVGPTGAGKTTILEALRRSNKVPTKIFVLNPKAQTVDELYGVLDPQSREWRDGLLSNIFRECNKTPPKEENRWILFDGDVDAVWVENMNSVMDDNKLLTLFNGERIRLENFCKMLFEVYDLQYASPATISRCGMVYVDPKDLGYNPYFKKWMRKWEKKRDEEAEMIKNKKDDVEMDKVWEPFESNLREFYEKFIPPCIRFIFDGINEDKIEKPLDFFIPRSDLNMVSQMLRILDSMLPEDGTPPDYDPLEHMFIFSIVWSLGTVLTEHSQIRLLDFIRKTTSKTFEKGSLFDYFYDYSKSRQWILWDKKFEEEYQHPEDGKFSKILVPTSDTKRFKWLFGQITGIKKLPVLFVGRSGTAKSVILQNYLNTLDTEKFIKLNINFSSRTTSMDVQKTLEDNIDKRSGSNYGPVIGKTLMVFVDDVHMPKIDKYGTQQPIALLKFLIDKGFIYDRGQSLAPKYIKDTQFLSALLPPGGGTNSVDPRFLSLFSVFCIHFPPASTVEKIYSSILKAHLRNFPEDIQNLTPKITECTLKLYNFINENLPRTPVKFHYIFNLRDLSRIYEGLLRSTIDKFSKKETIIRLWRNECSRVFADKLITEEDRALVEKKKLAELVKELSNDIYDQVMADPLIFGDYMKANPAEPEAEDPKIYEEITDWDKVQAKFNNILIEYNDVGTQKEMNLVLFKDALEHLTKIIRIIGLPRGHALLVGFGGSGKQSLTRLATFTCKYDLFQITLSRGYRESNFREDLKKLYEKLCVKKTVFLFTDAHVVEEGFLELLNNMLTVGMVPALFDGDGKSAMTSRVMDAAKKAGITQTNDELWKFFLETVRDNLHIVLAMSPAGETLRIRCRNFPGLVSNTSIDWFFSWPEEALSSVADYYLKDVELENEIRESITKHFVVVHTSVQNYSKEFELKLKRKNFSTPKNYLDFLNNYKKSLADNRKKYSEMVKRYADGLKKLAEGSAQVEVLQAELKIKQAEVETEKAEVEKLLAEIIEKKSIAEKKQADALKDKQELDIKNIEIARDTKEAEEFLAAAQPELDAAMIEVSKIEQKKLEFLKNLPNPPKAIVLVGQTMIYLKPTGKESDTDDSWGAVKSLLSDAKALKESLVNYASKIAYTQPRQIKKVQDKIAANQAEFEKIGSVSAEAKALYIWVCATVKFYDVYRKVKPLQEKVESMRKTAAILRERVLETQIYLDKLKKELDELNDNMEKKTIILNKLKEDADKMARKLTAAETLISGLGSEQIRWGKDKDSIAEKREKLVGDCLVTSSFLSYAGPFDFSFRKKMIYEHWLLDVQERTIPVSEGFKLEALLTTDVEISLWASQGLPSDELSVQNGILTTRANRWPLCIDPQLQAMNWIKKREKDLTVMTFNEPNFLKLLENCIKFGKPYLFESVDSELDPIIDPVLEKNIVIKAGQKLIKLGDNEFEYNEKGFRLYLTSKLGNPNYTPEIMSKTMVINYSVTKEGLADQLLNVVVGFERPDKEELRKQLIVSQSEYRKTLKELEDLLLKRLAEAKGNLLDDEELISTLQEAKKKAVEIQVAIEEGETTAQEIEIARQSYIPVAWRGSILFFAMAGLSAISEMYEYSLNSYLAVFNQSLKDAKKDSIVENRIRLIIDKLTQNVFDYTTLGIFEVHKLMFSFQMTIMIKDKDGSLNHSELDFFLKGNTSLDQNFNKKPYDWIPEVGWKDVQKLKTIGPEFKDLVDSIENNEQIWKEWYDQERPEDVTLPAEYAKLDRFQILLLLRVFRPDRVVNGIKKFIIDYFKNEHYVTPPTFQPEKVYAQSNEFSPIVFILSPGADPLSDVIKLSEQMGFGGNKFKYMSLGQGAEAEARQLVETSSQRGLWVMLQNCHLLPKYLKDLEKQIDSESFKKGTAKDFRLWLTTQPTEKFPLGILQKSLKVVTEPPDGLKLNMKSIMSQLTEEDLAICPHFAFKPLVYVLSFFHAIVQDRRKYGKIGWNVSYDFNFSDFKISFSLLSMYLKKAFDNRDETIPWASLKYLTGEAMYGGRVTDEYDRRVLNCYLDEYMGDFLFDKNREFFFCKTKEFSYIIPKQLNLEGFMHDIQELPIISTPEIFGLNPNAEITYYTNSAKSIWDNLLKMQSSGGDSGQSSSNRDEYIGNIASDIINKVPIPYDVIGIRKAAREDMANRKDGPKDFTPTQVVLYQELERINNLIEKMADSLSNLKKALKGEIGMSSELDELAVALFNGFLPGKNHHYIFTLDQWRKLAPQTEKKLGSWIEHFLKRLRQYNSWLSKEEPVIMWLSGLHVPESYLTALVQTTCRAKNWALDKSTLYTVVMKTLQGEEIKKRPEHGCYITGLYLEGAGWDIEKSCIRKQNPKELICQMPIIQVVPIEANKLKLKDSLRTPVYVTQNRRNAMGVGLVFEADLHTKEHPSHWVLQGVALVLNIDT